MSSTSRSPEDKADPSSQNEEDKKSVAPSPGRYSMASEGSTEMAAVRIDSTHAPPLENPRSAPPRSAPPRVATDPPPVTSATVKKPTLKLGGLVMPASADPAKARASSAGRPPPLPPRAQQKEKAKAKEKEKEKERETEKPIDSQRDIGRISLKQREAAEKAITESAPPPAPPVEAKRPPSLRPPPPPKKESKPPIALEGFDEGSIAHAFDALVSDRASEPGLYQVDLSPVRELFAELSANHMRHVRDFMIDVKLGEVTRDWIEICIPPVRTLGRAAERLDLSELASALDRMRTALEAASSGGAPTLTDAEKATLLETYSELVTLMPQAFALDQDRSQREAVIVQALLLQVPDVRKVTIDKLHAAGLTSLRALFDANAQDMVQVADIPHSLASKIVERVRAYREELATASPSDARAAEREKLATLTTALSAHHRAYEEAANGWGPDAKAKKRDCFRQREETWLAISVLLARFGEVDRLRGIEKVPFAQRIAQLSSYLEEAAEKYAQLE